MITKEFLNKLTDIVDGYLNSVNDDRVVEYHNPDVLRDKISAPLQDNGIDEKELFSLIEGYLKHCVNTSGYRFSNQLYNGFIPAAFAGEVVTAITNTSMATYEIAPAATVLEKELVEEFADMVGFDKDNRDGIMVTGGSNANMVAMMCARQKTDKLSKSRGIGNRVFKAFVSEQCHYSFGKAAAVLGIGTDNLVAVKSDDDGRMIPQALEEEIRKSLEREEVPFFVGATSGTTVMGSFDPLKEIGEIAQRYNIWLHVDGAWGGAALLSPKYKYLLDGVDRADSFSIDAHKLMGVPLIASFFVVNDRDILRETNSGGGSEYIFHDYDYEFMDTGTKSIQCGRRVDALKVWLTWKLYGRKGYQNHIDTIFRNRNHAVALVKKSRLFSLIREPQFINICFGLIDDGSGVDREKLILTTRKRVVEEGKYLVNYSVLKDGEVCFRQIISNPSFTEERLDEFFAYLEETTEKVKAELLQDHLN